MLNPVKYVNENVGGGYVKPRGQVCTYICSLPQGFTLNIELSFEAIAFGTQH